MQTSIHVIASELGAQVCEWMTPTPTLWQEHVHNTNSGIQYLSKFDEFENFVDKIQKYSLLCSTSSGDSRKPIIIVIDDIPVTNGRVAFIRLSRCLASLTHSAQVPTVISITEYHKTDSSDNATQYWEEIASAIEHAGAYRVSFNPVTVNSIKKTLTKLSQEEKFDVPAQCIDQIAKVSGGDIRHAITSLQYFTLRREDPSHMTADCFDNHNLSSNSSFGVENLQISVPWGRDETVTLFHALGKFLHNKRVASSSSSSQDSFALKARFMRDPLKSDDPEKVLSQAHGQPRPIADFLHENVLDFIGDDAIEDASIVTSYLSDADYLSNFMHSSMASDRYEASNIPQSIAASVAVRGVSFGNSHPAPSRWHTIRRPRLWQIEQSSRHNKIQMLMERFHHHNYSSCSISSVCTEYKPATKWLLPASVNDLRQNVYKRYSKEVEVDYMDTDGVEESNNEEIEDDIEDW